MSEPASESLTKLERNDNETPVVDSIGEGVIADYERLIKEFGLEPLQPLINKLPHELRHIYMTRGLMFAHIDFEPVLQRIIEKKPFFVMTGIKPSGEYHIGSLATAQEVVYFQKVGGKVYFCIADFESYYVNGVSFKDARNFAIDNLADIIALGLDPSPEHAYIYRQSTEPIVQQYGLIFSNHLTLNTLFATYGKKEHLGDYNAAMIQAADILLPQIIEGPLPTVVPVGADQAPHGRITRDLARKERFQKAHKFILPSFTFHLLLKGIDGTEKMSKRFPMSYFSMNETEKSIEVKIKNAFTGGRDTAKEQRKLGGRPEICRVFDLFTALFEPSDTALKERENACRKGELLCGPCKKDLLHAIFEFRKNHLEKKEQAKEIAHEIIKETEKREPKV